MSQYQLRTFRVDVTPPIGMNICGWLKPAIEVESPLELRGILLSDEGTHYIVAAIDYCYMIGRSQRRFEDAIAEAAGIPHGQVVLQSNHVHDAPVFNEEILGLINRLNPQIDVLHNEEHFSEVLEKARRAIAEALAEPGRTLRSVAFTEHRVHRFGSTRRCLDENNRANIRWSKGIKPGSWLKEYPEGRIDRILSQIVFFDPQDKPITSLNFYASHPQVSNGRRLWSSDTIGIARDLFEQVHPEIFPIYFNGCGGDVTAGKYTTEVKERDRLVFGTRLFDAMHAAFEKARPVPFESIEWSDRTIDVPLSKISDSESFYEAIVARSGERLAKKYLAALKLNRLQNNIHHYPFRLTRLSLNGVAALFLPAELIVDYQLYAKDTFQGDLAVAAYGDSFLNYVAIDASFPQGGYETQPELTEVEPGIEKVIKRGIAKILGK